MLGLIPYKNNNKKTLGIISYIADINKIASIIFRSHIILFFQKNVCEKTDRLNKNLQTRFILTLFLLLKVSREGAILQTVIINMEIL